MTKKNKTKYSWYDPDEKPFFFTYTKAFALGFNPASLERPFLCGGEHGGIYDFSPEGIRRQDYNIADIRKYGYGWIEVFIDKMDQGADFTVEELIGGREVIYPHGYS